jgi:AcrR family transcriptional regulator
MSRLAPQDWCRVGLDLLRDEGMEALTIDRLCGALRKTKGSFYHHFRDLDAFLAALLDRWEEDLTEAPMRVAERETDPRQRRVRLDDAVFGLDHRLDRAVRAWALWDPRARAAMNRVDERRIAYLAEIARSNRLRQPRLIAELDYLAFVGAQQVDLFASPVRAARIARALRRALAIFGTEKRRRSSDRSARPPKR